MADFSDHAFRLAPDSDIVRINPGVLVQVFTAGTDTLVTEVTANADGHFEIGTLATGKYDIRIAGQTVKTIQHVKADHTHPLEPTWQFLIAGAISADVVENNAVAIHTVPAVGKIVSVRLVAQNVTATGDVFVHLLKGASHAPSPMTLAGNTIWNHRINPGSAEYRFSHVDSNPGIALAAGDCITVGVDHITNGVTGLTVELIFRTD